MDHSGALTCSKWQLIKYGVGTVIKCCLLNGPLRISTLANPCFGIARTMFQELQL